MDLTGDETSWATASPGEAGSGVTYRVPNKTGVSKGGHTVIISDSHQVRPRAYMHRHKLHDRPVGRGAIVRLRGGLISMQYILDLEARTVIHFDM